MALLVDSGCLDVTEDLDVEGFSNMAISAGGFGDVYRGKLQNGLLVAVKCPRWLAAGVEKGQGVFKVSTVSAMLRRTEHSHWNRTWHVNYMLGRNVNISTFLSCLEWQGFEIKSLWCPLG